jgi:predicted nucleic acid-binding protein
MPAERRTFDDALEPFIYWDSSFAIAHVLDTEFYYAPCLAFGQRLDAEGIISTSSEFVHNELAFRVLRGELVLEARRTEQHWQEVARRRPDIILATMPQIEANRVELNHLTISLPINVAVQTRAFDLMRQFALLPTDAYHVAVALESGVSAFATLDEDFLRVEGIIVYTCLP